MTDFEDFERLYAYLDGELAADAAADFKLLLARDEPLRALLAEAEELRQLTRSVIDTPAPMGLNTRIMAEVRATEQRRSAGLGRALSGWFKRLAVPAAVAVSLAVMLLVGLPSGTDDALRGAGQELLLIDNSQASAPQATVEIEELEAAGYNVMILAAPGTGNQIIWLSPQLDDEKG